MLKPLQKIILVLILTFLASGCVNLKYVNEFSTTSLKSVKEFEGISYNFKQNCLDNCLNKAIAETRFNANECDCKANEKADSITLVIYNSVKAYFDGLINLSVNKLTSYRTEALTKALTAEDIGPLKIDQTHADAYTRISDVLLHAVTDSYRRAKLKHYIKQANAPLQVLLTFLDFNLSGNLRGKLNVQKQRLKGDYFDLTKDASLSTYEKRQAIREYYQLLAQLELREKELLTYSKCLKKVAEGHQKLATLLNKGNKDIKEQLMQYTCELQDTISEFKKLK